ncbi:MAG: hypothetical protein KJZ72_14575 [Anaerolineales bacterium]|nr:hypothetical protein [Anaerolineales bacterium]
MQLTSIYFFLFAFIVIVLFYFTPSRQRWLVLLAASVYYYLSWSPEYFLFIGVSVGMNFYLGKRISSESDKKQRKKLLLGGVWINLLSLFVFKYSGFLLGQLQLVFLGNSSEILLLNSSIKPPIGISFYTLQMIAYLLDTYSNIQKSENHAGHFALFATFFPLQISGPIERAKNLLPQFNRVSEFDPIDAREGLKRIGWGVFKKLVIANRLAIYVNEVFNNPANYHGFPAIIAVIFFAFQLYCDFSGYTDIVLGIARILGYRLTENFKNPYFSSSVQKFWNTWHISLSTWLRDYIFFPLRRTLMRTKNLPPWLMMVTPPLITMFISGLWHGEGWNYLFWGLLHGIYLIAENLFRPIIDSLVEKKKLGLISWFYRFSSTLFTFFLVCIGWVFFRANSIADAFLMLENMKDLNWTSYQLSISNGGVHALLEPFIFDGGLNMENFLLSIFLIVFLPVAELAYERFGIGNRFNAFALPIRWLFYCAAIFAIIMFSADSSTQNFIYFNF